MSMFNYQCDEDYQKIKDVSQNYPQLTTFEKEWLYFDRYGYNPGFPVELEYQTVQTNDTATVLNAIPYYYKRAILKGSTLVNMVTLDTTKEYVLEQDGSSIKVARFNLIDGFENDIYTIMLEMSNVNIVNPNGSWVVYISTASEIDNIANNTTIKSLIKNGRVSFTYSPNRQLKTKNYFNICLHTDSGVGSTITIKNVVVLKGDHTQEDIPYFEGMQSVKMPVLTTTGKNLFDGKILNNKDISATTGEEIGDKSRTISVNFIKVTPNTSYTLTRPVASGNIGLRYYSLDQSFISSKGFVGYAGFFNATFTTPENCYFIKFVDESNTLMSGYQIEKGTIATTYEPYQSNILTVNEEVELREIGNVKDELNLLTGELTQRIGQEILNTNNPNIKNYKTAYHNNTANLCAFDIEFKLGHHLTDNNDAPLSDKLAHHSKTQTLPSIVTYADTIFVVRIPFKNDGTNLTLEEFKAWLDEVNPTVYYKLATESIKTVDLSSLLTKPYEGVNHYQVSSDTINPTFVAEVPIVSEGEQTLAEINQATYQNL